MTTTDTPTPATHDTFTNTAAPGAAGMTASSAAADDNTLFHGGGGSASTHSAAAASGPFAPTFDGALKPDGSFAEGWAARAFGPEYNGPLATVKGLSDMDKVMRDNIAAARAKVSPPDEKSSPEQVAHWRKLVGAPEKPEAYGDLRPQQIPPEMWDKESAGRLAQIAHKHHLSPSALKDIVGMYGDQVERELDQWQTGTDTALAGERARLQMEWGERYDDQLRAAQRFASTLGLKADNPIFTSAEVVMAMARGTRLVGEGSLVEGRPAGLANSPAERASAIMTNTSDPLYAKYQSGDADTVALVGHLLQGR